MFHILVVDDDKNTLKYISALLEAENYTVSTARNGKEALAVIDKEYIDPGSACPGSAVAGPVRRSCSLAAARESR